MRKQPKMYKSIKHARNALAKYAKMRAYTIEGEVVSPAEEWLLSCMSTFLPIRKNDIKRGYKRKLLGIARSLDLYPIPDWWHVRQRIRGKGLFETDSILFSTLLEQTNLSSTLSVEHIRALRTRFNRELKGVLNAPRVQVPHPPYKPKV